MSFEPRKGVWLEPKSLGSGMKANMPERWQDKKNAAGNRFLARTTVSAPYAMLYAGQGSFHAAKVPDATKPGSGPPELQARSRIVAGTRELGSTPSRIAS